MTGKKMTSLCIRAMKSEGRNVVALTAYDFPTARILDKAGVDLILVGDSAANVVLGYDSTLPVSMEEMLMLTAAVCRGARRALVVADMPFLSYQLSPEQALENAGRFVREAGAGAVKVEGGRRTIPAVAKIVETGIPVMGHLGLTPQSHLAFGGHRVQGRGAEDARRLVDDAVGLEEAGAFSIVLEGIPWTLAREISDRVGVPCIGIGAGAETDGQILVLHDMLGISETEFRFVKRYDEISKRIDAAVRSYADDVRQGRFPAEEHRFEPGPRGQGASGSKGGEG